MSATNCAFKCTDKHIDELLSKAVACTFLVFSRVIHNAGISHRVPENKWQIILTLYPEAFPVKLMPKHRNTGRAVLWSCGMWRLCVVRPCAVGNPVTRLKDPLISAFPGGLGTWGPSREPDPTLECEFTETSLSSFQALRRWVRAALLDSGSPLPAQLVPSQVRGRSGNQGRRSSGQAEQPSGHLLWCALWECLLPGAAIALSKALVTDTFFIVDVFPEYPKLGALSSPIKVPFLEISVMACRMKSLILWKLINTKF